MSTTFQGHRKIKQKRQKCRQSVVVGRQQLYCAVQSALKDDQKDMLSTDASLLSTTIPLLLNSE